MLKYMDPYDACFVIGHSIGSLHNAINMLCLTRGPDTTIPEQARRHKNALPFSSIKERDECFFHAAKSL